jgi:hypothetical protein
MRDASAINRTLKLPCGTGRDCCNTIPPGMARDEVKRRAPYPSQYRLNSAGSPCAVRRDGTTSVERNTRAAEGEIDGSAASYSEPPASSSLSPSNRACSWASRANVALTALVVIVPANARSRPSSRR